MNIINLEGGGFSPQSPSPGSAPDLLYKSKTADLQVELRELELAIGIQ